METDGNKLTDNKTNNKYISKDSIIDETLEQCKRQIQTQQEEITNLEEIIILMERKITKLEELLMIRRMQDKQYRNIPTVKVDLSDINGVCDLMDRCHDYIKELEHELNSLDGLYASDNPEFKEPFKLDFHNIIREYI